MFKIAINGFGRIGKLVTRRLFDIGLGENLILISSTSLKRNTDIGATINRASNGEGIKLVIFFGVINTIAIVINETPTAAPLIFVI